MCDLSEIIPFVKLEHIVLPARLTKTRTEAEEEAEERAKRERIVQDFLLVQESAQKQTNDIQKKHKE